MKITAYPKKTIYVDPDEWEKGKKIAKKQNRKILEIINTLLRQYNKRNKHLLH